MPDLMPTVWRFHLLPSGGPRSSPENAVKLCLKQGVVGVGWQVSPKPRSAEDYFKLGREKYGDRAWKTAAHAIVRDMAEDDLVWFRNPLGVYYLGQVSGDWEYRNKRKNRDIDIVNVRPCKKIYTVGTTVDDKIISNFIGGQAVRRIRNNRARRFSVVKFNEIAGENIPVSY